MSDNASVSYDFLSDEIVTQILLRLPIKSIITSICVCKTWKSIIQNPTFISTHLHHSTTTNHLLLFTIFSGSKQIYALHNDDDNDFTEHTRFDFLVDSFTINPRFRVVATCNGLVCFSDDLLGYTNRFYLWNPCVRKYVKLPYPNFTFEDGDEFIHSIGFGFDRKTNDYKVVRMVSPQDDPDCGKDRPMVEVYTLSTGEWRMVTPVLSPICILHDCPTPAFVNGALHWIGVRRDTTAFVNGALLWIGHRMNGELSAVYGNSIALFHSSYFRGFLDIWVMKEYGVASSWTKVLAFTEHNPGDSPLALGFRRNSQLVLQVQDLKLISVDLGNQNMKDLGYQNGKDIGINTFKYTFVGSYVESLVLLDKAANGSDMRHQDKLLIKVVVTVDYIEMPIFLLKNIPIEPCSLRKQLTRRYCLLWVVKN
uniref:F-box domain-containing protein n=1 Tax=Fagus sylvatica TaxID=28930 RepID=A0A2N9HUR4_FAGSY